MLPIYNANTILKPRMSGGASYPCLMGVEDEKGNPKNSFVVKLFRKTYDSSSNATLKEFVGILLGKMFGLKAPDAALIYVDTRLIANLIEQHGYEDIEEGYYFGTTYLHNNAIFIPNMHESEADRYVLELLFAFDMLVHNVDRRIAKPNLLIYQREIYIIDHERIFTQLDKPFLDIALGAGFPENKHLALDLLRFWNKQTALTFDEFGEYLRNLQIEWISRLEDWLVEYEIVQSLSSLVAPYLCEIQAQPTEFIHQLKQLLS